MTAFAAALTGLRLCASPARLPARSVSQWLVVFVETIINFMLVVEVTVGIVAQGRVRLSHRGSGGLRARPSLALRSTSAAPFAAVHRSTGGPG